MFSVNFSPTASDSARVVETFVDVWPPNMDAMDADYTFDQQNEGYEMINVAGDGLCRQTI